MKTNDPSPVSSPHSTAQDPARLKGADLAAWRRREGLTQVEAAARLGVQQGTISRAEGAASAGLGPRLNAALKAVLGVAPPAGSGGSETGPDPGAEPVQRAQGTAEPDLAPKKQHLSKLAPFSDQIGVLPDATVASMAGSTRGAVQAWRKRKGIPPPRERTPRLRPRKDARVFPQATAPSEARDPIEAVGSPTPETRAPVAGTGGRRGRPSKINRYRDVIGTVPDTEVAAMAGVALSTVRGWRKAMGLEPAHVAPVPRSAPMSRMAAACSNVEARAPLAETAGTRAFLVTADDESEFVVVADDLAEAASAAVRSLAVQKPGILVVALAYVADHLGG